jgi:hypothetical protein
MVRRGLLHVIASACVVAALGACGFSGLGSATCDDAGCPSGPGQPDGPDPTTDGGADGCVGPGCDVNLDGAPMDTGAADAPDGAVSILPDVLWLDAERIVGLANGAEVSTWDDASGKGRNATQSMPTRRPKLMTNIVGGKPAVRFDGSSTHLVAPKFALFPTSSSPLTVVMVFATTTLTSQRFVLMQPQTNCTNNFELGYRTGTASRANFGLHAGCFHADITSTDIDTQWHVHTTVIAATGTKPGNVKFFRDGAQIATQLDDATGWPSAGGYGTQSKKLVVGARDDNDTGSYNSHHAGDVAEIMIFSVALEPAQRTAVEASLKTKYGL